MKLPKHKIAEYERMFDDLIQRFQFNYRISSKVGTPSELNHFFLHYIYDRFAEEYRYRWGPILQLYGYGLLKAHESNDKDYIIGFSFQKRRGISDYWFLQMVANFITYVRKRSKELKIETGMCCSYIVYWNCSTHVVKSFYDDIDTP